MALYAVVVFGLIWLASVLVIVLNLLDREWPDLLPVCFAIAIPLGVVAEILYGA